MLQGLLADGIDEDTARYIAEGAAAELKEETSRKVNDLLDPFARGNSLFDSKAFDLDLIQIQKKYGGSAELLYSKKLMFNPLYSLSQLPSYLQSLPSNKIVWPSRCAALAGADPVFVGTATRIFAEPRPPEVYDRSCLAYRGTRGGSLITRRFESLAVDDTVAASEVGDAPVEDCNLSAWAIRPGEASTTSETLKLAYGPGGHLAATTRATARGEARTERVKADQAVRMALEEVDAAVADEAAREHSKAKAEERAADEAARQEQIAASNAETIRMRRLNKEKKMAAAAALDRKHRENAARIAAEAEERDRRTSAARLQTMAQIRANRNEDDRKAMMAAMRENAARRALQTAAHNALVERRQQGLDAINFGGTAAAKKEAQARSAQLRREEKTAEARLKTLTRVSESKAARKAEEEALFSTGSR